MRVLLTTYRSRGDVEPMLCGVDVRLGLVGVRR